MSRWGTAHGGVIALLTADPRPPSAKKLKGRVVHRVRVGGYRVVYSIEDDILLMVVVTIGHRV